MKLPRSVSSVDWRIWLGLVLTFAYLAYGVYHVVADVGWSTFSRQSLAAQGSFLEGAFAPLAFLWLVIGYFLQHKALQENNRSIELQYRAMRRSAEHASVQAKAISASEKHARQETFLHTSDLVNNQLGVIAGMLYFAVQGPHSREAGDGAGDLWARVNEDPGMFSRKLLGMCYGDGGRRRDGWRVFYGSNLRRRYTDDFLKTFNALLEAAREADPRGLIADAVLMGTAHGHLFRTIDDYRRERQGDAALEVAEGDAA